MIKFCDLRKLCGNSAGDAGGACVQIKIKKDGENG